MQRGTPITVFRDGFRIGEENLAAIGVADGSTCWGVWVPNRNLGNPSNDPSEFPHFLISPFEPSSWPILFRVEMCIDGSDPNALAAALKPLADVDLSILSIDVTPAGHRHSVVTIIGEALSLKVTNGILDYFKEIPDKERTFKNDNTWELIHKKLAPAMLKKSEEIVAAVVGSDDTERFLRAIFLDPERPPTTGGLSYFERGVLYDYSSLPNELKALGKQQRTPAVRCTWMQNLAFFWLYRKSTDRAIQLNYNGPLRLMKVNDVGIRSFSTEVAKFFPPFSAIALIDQTERFLRVVLSPDDGRNRTVQVTIPFHAKYQAFQGSKGFQHQLYSRLARAGGLKLRHVSMSTHHRNLDEEKGQLSLLVANIREFKDFSSLDDLRNSVQEIADKAAELLINQQCQMSCERVTVQRFSAPLVFLSTKTDWARDFDDGNLKSKIREMAMTAGFSLMMGDLVRAEIEDLVPEVIGLRSITDLVPELIRHSAALLQIIPVDVLQETSTLSGSLHWLLFEFGVARALRLPIAILVDVGDHHVDIPKWKEILRVGTDYQLHAFNSKNGSKSLHEATKTALEELAKQQTGRMQ